jgi:peptidoglycan/xylan/chitin deacetylase (PgdA/CDA1 family)
MMEQRSVRWATTLLLLASAPSAIAAARPAGDQTAAAVRSGRVALTFDDLPTHSTLPAATTRADIARSIVATLRSAKAPPTFGFVNAKGLQDAPETAEVLQIWRAAGHPLGNHAYSHMDLHKNTAAAFEEDILAGEPALRAAMGEEDWQWFRYPYLREGDTLEKRHAIAGFLKERGYRVAEVTMSFDDYAYNDPYARCLAARDTAGIDWLKESYLHRADASLTEGQRGAREIYGRDIAHVMLLHVGAFQMVMLPRLMDLLKERGFTLVTLPEAQADPAYTADSDVATKDGSTLLERMRAIRNLPPPTPDDFFTKIGTVCR